MGGGATLTYIRKPIAVQIYELNAYCKFVGISKHGSVNGVLICKVGDHLVYALRVVYFVAVASVARVRVGKAEGEVETGMLVVSQERHGGAVLSVRERNRPFASPGVCQVEFVGFRRVCSDDEQLRPLQRPDEGRRSRRRRIERRRRWQRRRRGRGVRVWRVRMMTVRIVSVGTVSVGPVAVPIAVAVCPAGTFKLDVFAFNLSQKVAIPRCIAGAIVAGFTRPNPPFRSLVGESVRMVSVNVRMVSVNCLIGRRV